MFGCLFHIRVTLCMFVMFAPLPNRGSKRRKLVGSLLVWILSAYAAPAGIAYELYKTYRMCRKYEQAPERAPAKHYPGWAGARIYTGFLLVTTNKNPNKHPPLLPRPSRRQNYTRVLAGNPFFKKNKNISIILKKWILNKNPGLILIPANPGQQMWVLVRVLVGCHQQKPGIYSRSCPAG